jgi:hypothetical protein
MPAELTKQADGGKAQKIEAVDWLMEWIADGLIF